MLRISGDQIHLKKLTIFTLTLVDGFIILWHHVPAPRKRRGAKIQTIGETLMNTHHLFMAIMGAFTNPGSYRFIAYDEEDLKERLNVSGYTIDDFCSIVKKLELQVVKHGMGLALHKDL